LYSLLTRAEAVARRAASRRQPALDMPHGKFFVQRLVTEPLDRLREELEYPLIEGTAEQTALLRMLASLAATALKYRLPAAMPAVSHSLHVNRADTLLVLKEALSRSSGGPCVPAVAALLIPRLGAASKSGALAQSLDDLVYGLKLCFQLCTALPSPWLILGAVTSCHASDLLNSAVAAARAPGPAARAAAHATICRITVHCAAVTFAADELVADGQQTADRMSELRNRLAQPILHLLSLPALDLLAAMPFVFIPNVLPAAFEMLGASLLDRDEPVVLQVIMI
jgi:hypothetical protein